MESGKVVAGKYRLNQLLGTGGMAEVWSATNTFTERQLAIKFMNMQVAKGPEAATRFLKEAKVSARVNHPNIIEIHDVGQAEDGQLFLVMELLTGFPLEVALRRQNPPMTFYELALVMIEVGDALAAAHRSGVIHRDLKPSNIFLHKPLLESVPRSGSRAPMPKLLDFGVSKFLEDDQNHALTIAGTVLGSPLYMSPEQARGESQLDGRTDVFAFGAILFEGLCGYRAYEAKNFNALIVKIATTAPKSIDQCAPHAQESLRSIVRDCLEVKQEQRPQTFEEIVARLRAILPELEASPLRLPTPLIATAVVDPDATNALPVMRASDRPPALEHMLNGGTLSMSGSVPPNTVPPFTSQGGPTAPSWHTPNTSYASVNVAPRVAFAGKGAAWVIASLGVLVVVALAAGIGLGWRSRGSQARAAQPEATPKLTTAAQATAVGNVVPAPSAPEPVSVSIDSLPTATATASSGVVKLGPVPHGSGRLFVNASPGWCELWVDGKSMGATPVAGIDLASGAHQLRCEGPSGKVKTSNVTVQDGATSRIKLALDD